MKKLMIIMVLLLTIVPFSHALGDRWDLIFSDGTTTINGTDICLDDGTCLSQAVANASGDITAVLAGTGLIGGGASGDVTLNVSADTCGAGDVSKYNGTHFECVTDQSAAGGQGKSGDGTYLYNDTDTMYFNDTYAQSNLNVNSSNYWDTANTWNATQFENNAGTLSIIGSWLTSFIENIVSSFISGYFDQSLNTTDNVTFANVTADYYFGDGSQLTGVTATETDPYWSGNSSSVARIGDCPAGQFVQNTTTGGVECAAAGGSGDITSVQGDNIYIYNGSDNGDVQLAFNETKMNLTNDDRFVNIDGDTMTGELIMGGNNISGVGNFTAGYVNVSGDINIGNRLIIGIDPSDIGFLVNPGDVAVGGNLIAGRGSIATITDEFGPGLQSYDYGADDPSEATLYFNFSGELNLSTGIFCDSLNNGFTEENVLDSITTAYSSELGVSNIHLSINRYINSTCVYVETRIFLDSNLTELTTISYFVSPAPTFIVLDNGLVINGITSYFNSNSSSVQFGSYVRENTIQNRPGGNLFADAFRNGDDNLDYVFYTQTGLNNSFSGLRNSFGIFSTRLNTVAERSNLSYLHSANLRWNNINISPSLPYYSSEHGADLAVEHGIETQQLYIHDENEIGIANFKGDVDILLRNNDVDYDQSDLDVVGPMHIRQPIQEEIGFEAGEKVTTLLATFEQGTLTPLTLITEGKGADEWMVVSDETNCPTNGDFCSHAGPGGGSGETIMQDNFSTSDIGDLNLTFKMTTDGFIVAGNITVRIDDNEGNSESLYTLTGSDVTNTQINLTIPATYENKSLVTVDFIFSSGNPSNGDVWVDTINMTGVASANTTANVTRLNSLIKFGDGSINPSTGLPDYGIFYNDSDNIIYLLGNVSQTNVEQVDYNVTDSITLRGEQIEYWANLTQFITDMLLTDGSRSLTSNWDQGSFNLTNSNSWFMGTSNTSDYWDNLDTFNTTQMENSNGFLNILPSWLTSFINSWLTTKTTDDLTEGSINLYDNQSWNQSHADTLYYDISNPSSFWNDTYATFNKTYADTLYADISIDGTLTSVSAGDGMDFTAITSTGAVTLGTPSTLNGGTANALTSTSHTHAVATDSTGACGAGNICGGGHEHPASEVTTGTFGTGNYVMDTNLTVEKVVFENSANHYMEDNSTCVKIYGSTSVLEIC